jgi:Zn finger protein HypA/HybF involved in hydrogenase expression
MDKPIPQWLADRIVREDQFTAEIKFAAMKCDDCDLTVINRTVRHGISRDITKNSHIKSQCSECRKYKNPVTGRYDCTFDEINAFFRKKKYKTNK